jgi:hypothetical protein
MASPTETFCNSAAEYGKDPGYLNNEAIREKMESEKVASSHISSMSKCSMGVSRLKKGQSWKVIGNYDYDKHDGNTHANRQAEVCN